MVWRNTLHEVMTQQPVITLGVESFDYKYILTESWKGYNRFRVSTQASFNCDCPSKNQPSSHLRFCNDLCKGMLHQAQISATTGPRTNFDTVDLFQRKLSGNLKV